MKVKELIEVLQTYDPDLSVLSIDSEGYLAVPYNSLSLMANIDDYSDMDICKLNEEDIPDGDFVLI